MKEHRTPAKIAVLYAAMGCLWILFSDHLVGLLFQDPHTILYVSNLKGWGYVLVTSLLLYWLINGSTQRLIRSETVLKEQAEALAKSHDFLLRYELLAANSRDIILFLRRDDGRILDANLAAENAYGFGRKELLEMNIQGLRADQEFQLTAAQLERADQGGILFETTHRRRDGSTFPVEVSSQGATIGNERTIISVVRDISERRKREQALQEAYEQMEQRVAERTEALSRALVELKLETDQRLRIAEELREKERLLAQQNRQAAIGEMIGNVAHQWRQPLNALGLTVQQLPLLYDMGDLDRDVLVATVDKAMGMIRHMSRTIDDFRGFFRPDKEMVEFRTVDAVHKALDLVRDSLEELRIKVEIDCRNPGVVKGYSNEYSQVLLNILINARDAFEGQTVALPVIRIRVFEEGDRQVVTITDNAGGIPEGIFEKIFEPYFSTKGLQGTGIGLYMSKTIIERNMHGTLSARNTDSGAEFRIVI